LVLVSLALGWYAWVLGKRAVAPQPGQAAPAGMAVVVAAKPLTAGVVIPADGVKLETHPTRPQGAFEQMGAAVGKVPSENIGVGEVILSKNLLGGDGGFSHELQPGERAVALKVDEVSVVGNRLVPKDVVDVYLALRKSGEEVAETQAKLLLPDLRVLAVGSRTVQSTGEGQVTKPLQELPRTVVLAVPVKEVSRLALAGENGRLILALKNPTEGERAALTEAERANLPERLGEASKVTLRGLAGQAAVEPAAAMVPGMPAAPRGQGSEQGVEVIRGLGKGSEK
jgi:pilus assembly protein CpaB